MADVAGLEFYGGLQRSVPEGQYTATVYNFIAERKYNEVGGD